MQARGQLRLTWRLYAESPQSGEISPSHGTGSIAVGDLSAQSIMGAVPVCLPQRHAAPLEMTVAAGTIGHTCGVKVQRVQRVQRVQKGRFLGLTGLWPEGGGIALTGDEYEVSVTGLGFCVIGAAVSG